MILNSIRAPGKKRTIYGSIIRGIIAGITLTMVLCATGAWLIVKGYLGENSILYMPIVIVPVTTYIACVAATSEIGKCVVIINAITALAFNGILMLLILIMRQGTQLDAPANLLLILCGTGVSVLPGRKNKKGRRGILSR